MNEIKLTPKQLDEIFDKATHKFKNDCVNRERNFLVECVIDSFVDFLYRNKYNIENGKIIEKK